MANNIVQWAFSDTKAKYTALATKDVDTLYFIKETQEIFKGEDLFTEPVRIVSELPATPAKGVVYIKSDTLEGSVWNGTSWTVIIAAAGSGITDISFDTSGKNLVYTKGGVPANVPITGFVTDATYDGATGKLSFPVQGGNAIEITLPKDNFVKSGAYDETNKVIVLTLQDDSEVTIPATDLVNVNTFADTATTAHTVGGDGTVSFSVKLSADAGNALVTKPDGLYMDASGFKVDSGHADELISAKDDGSLQTTGLKVGGSELATTPNATTLATEAAVEAIRAALQDSITSNNGDFVKTADVVTTANLATPSATKVVSEQALVNAITWKTLA